MNIRATIKTLCYSTMSILLASWSSLLYAQSTDSSQSLTLFEDVESSNTRPNSSARPSRESRATISEPEFTLIGTSRIGGKHSAIVRHKSGEMLRVDVDSDSNTPLEGYSGYSIVDIAAGAISIRYPSNNACVDFSDQGVRCSSAGNIAELAIANAEPLESNSTAVGIADERVGSGDELVEELDIDPANPFERLRNGIGAQDADRTGGRFVPRRINPEDVPEGMRIVATPFGDRLVEQ